MRLVGDDEAALLKEFILSHENFFIVGHKEPDGDCIASCIGVQAIVRHLGRPSTMLSAGPFKRPEIRGRESMFSSVMPFLSEIDRRNSGLIIVDCSEMERLGEIEGDLSDLDTFIIDHHKTAEIKISGAKAVIDPGSPAAATIVQQLYEKICGRPPKSLAESLFLGFSTDSGYFRFLSDGSGEAFRAAARLVDCGANPKKIYAKMTGGKPWSTRKLLGLLLSRAELHLDGRLAVTYETMEDTRNLGGEGRDSDALYSALLSAEGILAAVFVRQETEANCTIGFRSQDAVDVSAVAAKFGGGGHKNASGASCPGKIATLIPSIVKEFARVMG